MDNNNKNEYLIECFFVLFIGLRFALMEIKLLLCNFLLKYEFVACKETVVCYFIYFFFYKKKYLILFKDKIELDNSGLAKSKVPIVLKAVKRN
jgi:hypothetical protein